MRISKSSRPQAHSIATQADKSAAIFAVYGSLALIAAIVFGTLPYRPF